MHSANDLLRNLTAKRIIGVVVPAFDDCGGVPAVARFILRAISRRPDFQARIVSLAMSAFDPLNLLLTRPSTWIRGVASQSRQEHGYDFVHVGARFGELEFQRLAPRPELARLLAGCDLIQVVAGAPSWAQSVIGLGVPVVLQTATLTAVERRMQARLERGPMAVWRSMMTRVVTGLDRSALQSVDAILVENPWMKAYCENAVRDFPTRVLYAPPGIDTDVFRPLSPSEPRADMPYFLSVGRFADVRKNPMLLLEAYAQLVARAVNTPDLVLAGASAPDERFWARVRSLGLEDRIRMVLGPSLEELATLFRRALCLVMSSDEEGFGVVVIESMASGVPVVSTRCGGPDGIITDRVDGYLVDRDNAEALAERMAQWAAAPDIAREMGRRARATVEARFSDKVAGDTYLRLYDDILSKP